MRRTVSLEQAQRRRLLLALAAAIASSRPAYADLLSKLTEHDASAGIKAALEPVHRLRQAAGQDRRLWGQRSVRIALPDWLHKAKACCA